ncbi:hypothetical protein [Dactylosporangium sp. NPDC050588]|uniref:hypothetical protein n=1 Tax=Dactylosporangium sp. NPDC050588 TaxID=3157211 RepID=UPI0033EAA2EA
MIESSTWAALAAMVMIVAAVAWIDARCLADLSTTPDRQLRHFDRSTWKMIIIVSFPIGPALYMAFAKGPGRRS